MIPFGGVWVTCPRHRDYSPRRPIGTGEPAHEVTPRCGPGPFWKYFRKSDRIGGMGVTLLSEIRYNKDRQRGKARKYKGSKNDDCFLPGWNGRNTSGDGKGLQPSGPRRRALGIEFSEIRIKPLDNLSEIRYNESIKGARQGNTKEKKR